MTERDPVSTAAGNGNPAMVGAFPPLPESESYHNPVWHFTDSIALVSILERKRLWASAATMINDPEELTYGAKRIKSWYDERGKELPKHPAVNALLTQQLGTILHCDNRYCHRWRQ